MKQVNTQRKYNKTIKNEDALFKKLAFGVMTEQKYKQQYENPDNDTHKDKEYYISHDTFERFYLRQLEIEAKQEPRPINPADYLPKKHLVSKKGKQPEWLDEVQQREKYFEDLALLRENKKEQHDRTALFFILEQFYEH